MRERTRVQDAKVVLRQFLQTNYGDESLAALYAHAKDGKMAFRSCCRVVIPIIRAEMRRRDRMKEKAVAERQEQFA